MATIPLNGSWIKSGVHKTSWDNLASGDVGAAQSGVGLSDKTVQIIGTLDGGGITMQGSNDTAAGPFFTLTDPQGNDIILTTSGLGEAIAENPLFIRPTTSGGSGSLDISVLMVSRG